MKVYVVKCSMEGCEECGNEYHIVGVFSTKDKAIEAEKLHEQYKHLHSSDVDIDECNLDEYIKSYREGEETHIKYNWRCKICGIRLIEKKEHGCLNKDKDWIILF